MRIATPVMAPDGALFGILIVNLDMQPAFDLLEDAGRSQQVYVVNERGDYLVNPEPAREFGFEFGKSFRWQNDFPQFAAAVGSVTQAARVTDTAAGERIGIAMSSVRLAEGPLVSVGAAVRSSVDAIIIKTSDGVITEWNPAAEQAALLI